MEKLDQQETIRPLIEVTVIDRARMQAERYLPHTQRLRAIPVDLIKFIDQKEVTIEGGKVENGVQIHLTDGSACIAIGDYAEIVNRIDPNRV
jgi:hypothetical protein